MQSLKQVDTVDEAKITETKGEAVEKSVQKVRKKTIERKRE